MRKLFAAMVAALALAAMTAATAGAQEVSKFSVQTVNTHHLKGAPANIQAGRLAIPSDDEDVDDFVGRFLARFNGNHVKAIAKFQDDGTIKFAGDFGNNNRLHILGGTGEWNGASGKVLIHNAEHGEVVLTFVVVQ